MALNPYNNKLYVGTLIKNDYDRYEKYYDYKIHILNSETLVEEGAFVISQKVTKVWSDGHETYYPDVSPRAMAFTDDGFGVIVLKEYTSQGVQLCYVDCRDGHSLKYDRDCWDFFYRDVKTNYDKKSLIIYCMDTFGPEFYTVSRNNPNPKLYAIDHKYHSTHPYAGGGISCRLLHKSKPLYYAQSLYSLWRIDYSTDTYSPVLIDDARSCKMEIDYLDDNFVVSVDPLLHVMKYKDTSADDIAYVSYWDRGVVLDSYYPMFHNTSRDMLITFLGPNGKTYLTMYDMKPIRQSKADKNSPY